MMLRDDFLAEMSQEQRVIQAMNESAQNDASLQFAWETIHEQKKEIVRLRAQIGELTHQNEREMGRDRMNRSFFGDNKPANPIDMLRSQISAHHDNNVSMLHDHIHHLETALHRATAAKPATRGRLNMSTATCDSSRDDEREFSRSAVRLSQSRSSTELTSTMIAKSSCDQCHRKAITIFSLEAQARQLRAQLNADQEALAIAENAQNTAKSECAALSAALFSSKQKLNDQQERLHQLTCDKRQLQEILSSYKDSADATVQRLTARIGDLESLLFRNNERPSYIMDTRENVKSHMNEEEENLDGELEKDGNGAFLSSGSISRQKRLSDRDTMAAAIKPDGHRVDRFIEEVKEMLQSNCATDGTEALVDHLASALRMKEVDNARLETALAMANKQLSTSEVELDRFKSKVIQLLAEIDERDERIAYLTECTSKATQDESPQLSELQFAEKFKSDHHNELGQTTTSSISGKLELSAAQAECDELRAQLDAARQEVQCWSSRCDEAAASSDAFAKQLKALQIEADRASEREQTRVSLEAAAHETLKQEYDQYRQHAEMKIDGMRKTHAQMDQEVADTKTTVLMWMTKHNEASDKCLALADKLSSVAEEKFALEQQLAEQTASQNRLVATIRADMEAKFQDELSKAVRTTGEKLTQANQRVTDRYYSQMQLLEDQNAELKIQLGKYESTIETMGAVDQKRRNTLTLVESTSQELSEEVHACRISNQRLQQQLAVNGRERAMMKKLIDTLEARPRLQKRAIEEMLLKCGRSINNGMLQILNKMTVLTERLSAVERRSNIAINCCRRSRKGAGKSIDFSESAPQHMQTEGLSLHETAIRYQFFCEMVKDLASKSQLKALRSLVSDENHIDLVGVVHCLFSYIFEVLETQSSRRQSVAPVADISIAELPLSVREFAPGCISNSENEMVSVSDKLFNPGGSSLNWSDPISPSHGKQLSRDSNSELRQVVIERWRSLTAHLVRGVRGMHVIFAFKTAAITWKRETKRWKGKAQTWVWRYAAQALAGSAKTRSTQQVHGHATQIDSENHRFMDAAARFQWQRLRLECEKRDLAQQTSLSMMRVLSLRRELENTQRARYFSAWRQEIRLKILIKKLHQRGGVSPQPDPVVFTPETTKRLGNCIYLLQRFCDDPTSKPASSWEVAEHSDWVARNCQDCLGHEELIRMLEVSNQKVAEWQIGLNRRMTEFTSNKYHLRKLKARCIELSDLVALNQRLVDEMERRAAGRQQIVDAAWNVAVSFRRIPTSLDLHRDDLRDLIAACSELVGVLHSFRIAGYPTGNATPSRKSSSMVELEAKSTGKTIGKRVKFVTSTHWETKTESAPTSGDTASSSVNISLLENAIASLQGMKRNRQSLEQSIVETARLLELARAALRHRGKQFQLLRAFIQWRCATTILRLQSRQQ